MADGQERIAATVWEVRPNPGPWHNLWLNGITASAAKADLSYLALAIRRAA